MNQPALPSKILNKILLEVEDPNDRKSIEAVIADAEVIEKQSRKKSQPPKVKPFSLDYWMEFYYMFVNNDHHNLLKRNGTLRLVSRL